jgi:homoserine dehydrogenase
MLASVRGVMNAVFTHSYALGPTLLYGQGAGMMPTAASVVSDIIEAARNLLQQTSERIPHLAFHHDHVPDRHLVAMDDVQTEYYIRLTVKDEPGVLAKIATVFGERKVSIRQLVQTEPGQGGSATIALLTHTAREGDVQSALAAIAPMPLSLEPPSLIRIEAF